MACLAVLVALLPAVAAFLYPLEIEVREGTMWLYVLAMDAGVDIYDHSKVAFVQMCFGPFDPLLKFWIHKALPSLQGWEVCRVPALLLPIAMVVAPIGFLANRTPRKIALACLLGSVSYLLMLATPSGTMMLTSRPDATTHLLAVIAMVLVWKSIRTDDNIRSWFAAFGGGLFAAFTYNAEWRSAPLLVFVLLVWWAFAPTERRWGGLGFGLAGFAAGFAFVLWLAVDFNLSTFWTHFYLFYLPQSGWGSVPYSPLQALLALGRFSLMPLVPIGCVALLWWLRRRAATELGMQQFALLIAGIVLTFLVLGIGYLHNGGGGGLYYFNPLFLAIWFIGCLFLTDVFEDVDNDRCLVCMVLRSAVVVVIVMAGWATLGKGAAVDTAFMIRENGTAGAVTAALRTASSRYGVASEDLHLFKQHYSGELIDQGDTVEAIMNANGYGPQFTATAKAYFSEVGRHPPAVVVKGFTASRYLTLLVEANYTCVYCGNRGFLVNGPSRGLEIHVSKARKSQVAELFRLSPIR